MTTEKNVEIYRCISILPDDYQEMDNKPTMNGATIEGDLTAKDLKLMSSDSDDYQSISKEEAAEKFIPVIDEDGNLHKISVNDLPTGEGGGNAGDELKNLIVEDIIIETVEDEKPIYLLSPDFAIEVPETETAIRLAIPLKLEIDKTYKISGTYGENNIAYETAGTVSKDGLAFDKTIGDMLTGSMVSMEQEGNACVMLMLGAENPSDAESTTKIFSPFTIKTILEVETVVEYASKQSVEAIEKRVESLESANDDNLLGNSIYVTETNIEETEGNHSNKIYLKNDLPMLGLVPDKQYKVIYTYNGVQHESNCLCVGQSFSEDGNSVGCILQGRSDAGELSPYALSFDNTNVMIFDKVAFCIPEGDSHYDENISSIVAIPNYDIGANELSLPFNIDIIMEIKEECASKKSVDELTERVIELEKANNSSLLKTPIEVNESNGLVETMAVYAANFPTLGLEDGKKYKVTYTFEEVQYEEICTAIDREGMLGLAGKLDDGSDSEFTLTFGNTVVNIIDKMEFKGFGSDGGTEYSDTLACIMAAPQSSEVAMSLPFRIDSIDEAKNVNLLIGEITYDVIADNSRQNLSYALGLEANKTYQIEGVFGSNATPYVVTATTLDMYEEVKKEDISNYSEEIQNAIRKDQEDCKGIICFSTKVIIDEDIYAENPGNGYIGISVYDNAVRGDGDFYDYSTNACIISFGWSSAGDGNPLIVKSIVEVPTEYATRLSVDNLETNIANIRKSYAAKSSVEKLEERVTILEKSNDTNLLGGEPITIQGNADGDSLKVVDFSLGMKAGQQYEIKANVDGQDVVVYGKTENPIENVVMLLPVDGGDFVMLVDQSVSLMLFDNCDLVDGEPAPANNKCVLGLQEYDEIAHLVILNSITEVQVEYAAKESIDKIEERVTALEKGDEPQNLLSEAIHLLTGSNVLNYSLGLEINKTYKLEGYVGDESNTYSATFTPSDLYEVAKSEGVEGEELEETKGIIAAFEDIKVTKNEFPNLPFNLTFNIFDNCNEDTYQGELLDFTENACTVGFYGSDPDTIVNNANVMLTSITEVQVEYATKEYVERIESQLSSELLSEPILVAESTFEAGNEMIYMDAFGLKDGERYKITFSFDTDTGTQHYEQVATASTSTMYDVTVVSVQFDKIYEITEGVDQAGYFSIVLIDGIRISIDKENNLVVPTAEPRLGMISFNKDFNGVSQPFFTNLTIKSVHALGSEHAIENIVRNADMMDARTGTIEAQLGGNILSEPVLIPRSDYYDGSMRIRYAELDKIGIVEGKSYNIAYVYDGVPHIATRVGLNTITSSDNIDIEGAVSLGSSNAREAIILGDSIEGVFMIADGASLDFSSGSTKWVAGTKTTICYTYVGEGEPKNLIITRIFETDKEYATKSYVDNLIAEINDKLEALLNGTEA